MAPATSDPNRPKVPDVLPLVRALYLRPGGSVGCCLHIVLDDRNLDNSSVDFCVQQAREHSHADCESLALMLRQMTITQRRRVATLI